ncbi:hypothetical protein [Helicobacter burdigaliensis]|uniref:hypothetical protein n=1 Tax=Helicobacter burdigaliensis TaxID=2315334 RepID=UPI00130048D9|nr:hypothetical protein [Helicobacter burdigaliensis]
MAVSNSLSYLQNIDSIHRGSHNGFLASKDKEKSQGKTNDKENLGDILKQYLTGEIEEDIFVSKFNNLQENEQNGKKITYGDIKDLLFEKYLNGEIKEELYHTITIAELTSSAVLSYQLTGSIKYTGNIAQLKDAVNNPHKIIEILKGNIKALDNMISSSRRDPITDMIAVVPPHTYQALKNQTKDIFLEIIENLKD